jgi:hypothetical protein
VTGGIVVEVSTEVVTAELVVAGSVVDDPVVVGPWVAPPAFDPPPQDAAAMLATTRSTVAAFTTYMPRISPPQ